MTLAVRQETVRVLRGIMEVVRGTEGLKLLSLLDAGTKQFIQHYEKQGWTLCSRPVARKVKPWDEQYRPVNDGKVTMWLPTSTGMREDDPAYVPDADQYEVAARFSRPERGARFDLSDELYIRLKEKGKLPKSLKLAD